MEIAGIEIRRARRADARAIEAIRIRGWQVAYRYVFPAEELDRIEIDPSRFEDRLEDPPPGQATYVAERDAQLLGLAVIGPDGDDDERGELYALYVDPDHWSTGVGRKLMEQAESALADDYQEAVLWVLEGNERARGFYEAVGWTADGDEKPFERFGVTTAVVRYRKRLNSSTSRG